MSNEIIPVHITKSPVELFKILKFEGIADSGAEAKNIVAEGHVKVNGEVETRKRRQIVAGDIFQIGEDSWQLVD